MTILNQHKKMIAAALLFAGLCLRLYFVFIVSPAQDSLLSDMKMYLLRGDEILKGIYDPAQNFQPLGFTFLSMGLRSLGGWVLFNWYQVLISLGTCWFIYLIGLESFGVVAGLFSLMLATFYFPQISLASFHLAECTYTFLITFSLWWVLKTLKDEKRWKYFVTGLLLMASFYFKGTHMFFVPLFSLWLLSRKTVPLKTSLSYIFAMALGCFIVMSLQLGWTSYAYQTPKISASAGALNFVEGKCPWKDNEDSVGRSWMSPLFVQIGGGTVKKYWDRPFTDEAFFWSVGRKCVQDDPMLWITSFKYIYYLFFENQLWPTFFNKHLSQILLATNPFFYFLILPLSVLGFFLLRKQRNSFYQISGMFLLSLFLTSYIFKSEIRFRVPFDGILILWSGFAIAWILTKVTNRLEDRRQRQGLPT